MMIGLIFVLLSALLHVTFSLHQFVYNSQRMNWTVAQTYCRQHYTDLATIDNQEDYDQLMNTTGMENSMSWYTWIGLYRTTSTGSFVWSDQSKSSYRNWTSGAPYGGLCVAVFRGFLIDLDCGLTRPFACYAVPPKRQMVKLEVKSSEDLNDLKVKNKILMKMEQILKEKGLEKDAKLSWRIQSDGNVFQKKEQKKNGTQ